MTTTKTARRGLRRGAVRTEHVQMRDITIADLDALEDGLEDERQQVEAASRYLVDEAGGRRGWKVE